MTNSRKILFEGSVISLGLESTILPNGEPMELEIVRHPGGAAAVALRADHQVCLLRQYRHAAGDWLWELPAGKREAGEDPQQTAIRELEEEAGLTATSWRKLGSIISSPAVCDEVIHLYLATNLDEVSTNHEPTEVIEVHWLPLATAVEQVHEGVITDAKTVTGLLMTASLESSR